MLDNYCITCLKIGDKYGAEYVNKLYDMVRQQTDAPFYCFTDNFKDVNCQCIIQLDKNKDWDNWWAAWYKIYLFDSPYIRKYDRKIFFDLDTIIHGDIKPILEYGMNSPRNNFALVRSKWRGASYQLANPHKSMFNSSVMVWKDNSHIYKKWMQDPQGYVAKYAGTDDFYHNEKIIRKPLPDIIYSYREGYEDQHKKWNDPTWLRMAPDYAVALLHQDPKPHTLDAKEHPIVEYWNGTATVR